MKMTLSNVSSIILIVIPLIMVIARPGQKAQMSSRTVIQTIISLSIMVYLKMQCQKQLSPLSSLKSISIACGGAYNN